MSWRVVFTDGTEQITPDEIDKVTTGLMADSNYLYCYQTMTYGPDELIRTYYLGNVRYWEKVRK
jgi:hypothetical protein